MTQHSNKQEQEAYRAELFSPAVENEHGVKMRKGVAMIDLLLYIGLAGVLLGALIWLWSGMQTKLDTSAFRDKVTTVISGIEKAKNDYNRGAYVASASSAIPSIQKLAVGLGGARATSSLGGWTYGCPAGNTSTITIQTENINDVDVQTGVVLYITDKYTDWTATVSGSRLSITRPNSVCN